MFALPVSTLRYSDKQGLFPNTERVSGIRKSGETEIEALRAPYANDPEFQKYEAYRDDGIDLARLE